MLKCFRVNRDDGDHGMTPFSCLFATEDDAEEAIAEDIRDSDGQRPRSDYFIIPDEIVMVGFLRKPSVAVSVLEAFKDNSAYEDYQRADEWMDREYEEELKFLKAVAGEGV